MGLLGDATSVATRNGNLFLLSLIVYVLEVLFRIGLSWQVSWLLFILWPPVIAVVAFGLAGTLRRERLFGTQSIRTTDQWFRLAVRLGVVAVLGHAIAVAVGGSIYLIIDTYVRALLYAAGFELLHSEVLGIVLPYLGVFAGTAFIWPFPAIAAVQITGGMSVRGAFRQSLYALLDNVRAFLTCSVVILAVSFWIGLFIPIFPFGAFLFHSPLGAVYGLALISPVLGCGTITISTAAMIVFVRGQAFFLESTTEEQSQDFTPVSIPTRRLVLACVLFVSLATVTGAIRMTETRHTDTAVKPLGSEPAQMYETAVQNTFSQSHTVVQYPSYPDENYTVRSTYDLANRRSTADYHMDIPAYSTVGVGEKHANSFPVTFLRLGRGDSNRTPGIHPAYVDGFPAVQTLPAMQSNTPWTILEDDDQIVLESTDVATIVQIDHIDPSSVQDVHEAWIRATIDPESRTLRSIEWSYAVNITDPTRLSIQTMNFTSHERFEFETNPAVAQPKKETHLSVRQRLWKLLIY